MLLKKKKQRSQWFEGLLLAERIISQGGEEEQIHSAIGSEHKTILCDPRGLRVSFWEPPKTELAKGALDFINFKK